MSQKKSCSYLLVGLIFVIGNILAFGFKLYSSWLDCNKIDDSADLEDVGVEVLLGKEEESFAAGSKSISTRSSISNSLE